MEENQHDNQEPNTTPSAHNEIASGETGHAKPGVHLSSKDTLFRVGIAIAILNPIFSGVIFGAYLWMEKETRREGKIITAIAIVWGIVSLVVLKKTLRGMGIEF